MSNFFSFDSSYQYEPVMRPLDQKVIDREMDAVRKKIMESIKQIIDQKMENDRRHEKPADSWIPGYR